MHLPKFEPVARTPARSAFELDPCELEALGVGAATFSALQGPWTWLEGAPRLSREKRARLAEFSLAPLPIAARERSTDGSTKLALEVGSNLVEAVHMPRAIRGGRVTLCVSSQVGCGMGCRFCATARMGLVRQLSTGEIVAQVLTAVHALGPRHPGALTLVLMGMGEPLHNPRSVERAVALLCDRLGLGLSPRRITLSTSGLVPEIEAMASWSVRPLLAVSLNATHDALRQDLMPVGRKYPLARLRETLLRYPLRPRERVTLEYVLLRGVNDSEADARRLADFCADIPHQLNLIPWNAHEHAKFEPPSDAAVDTFARAVLGHRRTLLTVRRSRALDVSGACGQLAPQSGAGHAASRHAR
jgi:23S rRNA (adenine2503-C2)-methyltransferase